MDAIQLIQKDHREVERLFKEFDRAARDGRMREQGRIVHDLVRELSIHAAVEEELVYPALRRAGVEDGVLDALEEHHATKLTLSELEALGPGAERYEAKVRLLETEVRHHVAEEERQLLPRLKRALDPQQLRNLADALVEAKRAAPTRPHPAPPDSPPANVFANAMAALVDRARDTMRDAFATFRMLVSRVGDQGSDVARFAMSWTGARSRQVVDEAAERGREAIARGRARATRAAGEARMRGGEVVELAGRRGEQGSRRVKQAGRQAQKTGRAETRTTVH